MTIRFACDQCGQRLSVSEEKVGKKAKCPKCKAPIKVPTPEVAATQLAAVRASRAGAEAGDALSAFVVYDDEDADLIYETEDEPPRSATTLADAAHVAVPRWILYAQGVLLGVVALLAFALGILVGQSTTPNPSTDVGAGGPVVLSGRVTFVNSANEQVPDEGSVVIALPAGARPEQKIAVEGLRPEDEPVAGGHPGVTAIRELGGAVARTDLDGNYRLPLSGADRYFLLVVSRHTRAADDAEPDREHLAQMGRYFTSALDLIDRSDGVHSKYRWSNERVRGDARLDHDFGRSRE